MLIVCMNFVSVYIVYVEAIVCIPEEASSFESLFVLSRGKLFALITG